MKKRTCKWGAGLVAVLAIGGMFVAQTAQAALFDFVDNDGVGFDKTGIGGFMSVDGITVTTVDVIGSDGTKASDGVDNTMNITGVDCLGVNTKASNGYSNETRDFNPTEGWVFSVNVDVTELVFDFKSHGAGAVMTLSSSAFSDIAILDDVTLSGLNVLAGTAMTLQFTSDGTADNSTRINTLEVIPEPATLGLLSACAVGAFVIRRFHI